MSLRAISIPTLLAAIFCLIASSVHAQEKPKSCKERSVAVEITNTTGQLNNGEINIKGLDKGEFTIHVLSVGNEWKNDRMNVSTSVITKLPSGQYDIIIVDPKGQYCPVTQKVKVN